MEASEKPQLQFEDRGSGSVRALGDRLVISELTVDDARTARVVRERMEEGEPAATTVVRAIEIGTRVMEVEGTAADAEFVRRELQGGLGELNEKLGSTLSDGAEAIAEQIAEKFGAERNDSVQGQIREIVTRGTNEQMQGLVKLLTAEDKSNPLIVAQMRMNKVVAEAEERHRAEVQRLREGHSKDSRAMQGQVSGLSERVSQLLERGQGEERVAEAEAAGTRKGFTFEERVDAALERIATVRGDCASHTGAEGAEGGGKKGDTLIELGAADGPATGRIVFESKDRQALSKKVAWDQLNSAMAARAASFGVLVVAGEEQIPSGRHALQEYEGNKLIVAVDRDDPDAYVLEVAYRLAAARVAMARDRELDVDAVAVRDTAAEAISMLKAAQAIRANLTGIKTSSDKARAGLDVMVAALEEKLAKVESLVAEASEELEAEAG
ncbi:hypothetical protein BH10ACT11_BH10ACT11_18020 [soil metagenome]